MRIAIRPADLPRDYPAIADVLEAEAADWAATAEEMAHEDAQRDPRYHHAVFVAEALYDTGPLTAAVMVGVAIVGHEALAFDEGRFEINLRVRPDWQGSGVGKLLYRTVLEHLAPFAPRELVAMAWRDLPRPSRFLMDRGFVEAGRRADRYLDVADFDFTSYAGLEERLRQRGIEVKTYADLSNDPARLEKLYELDWALWQDVPYGLPVAKKTLRQFAAEVSHPNFLADACFIAIHDGRFIGYSNLIDSGEGYNTDMTGVLRDYRGQGVGTLLKLRGVQYAQAHGNRRVWTVNDTNNAPILTLNTKLGFVLAGENIRYVKRM